MREGLSKCMIGTLLFLPGLMPAAHNFAGFYRNFFCPFAST